MKFLNRLTTKHAYRILVELAEYVVFLGAGYNEILSDAELENLREGEVLPSHLFIVSSCPIGRGRTIIIFGITTSDLPQFQDDLFGLGALQYSPSV